MLRKILIVFFALIMAVSLTFLIIGIVKKDQPESLLDKTVLHTPSEIEQRIFELVNEKRKEGGLLEYRYDLEIYKLAQIRAEECSETWSHTRPDGRKYGSVFDDYKEYKYKSVGENLGKNFDSAEMVVDGLMNSESHRANIMSERYDSICIAVYINENGAQYLCQLFGESRED